jgi:hypothetical protein
MLPIHACERGGYLDQISSPAFFSTYIENSGEERLTPHGPQGGGSNRW